MTQDNALAEALAACQEDRVQTLVQEKLAAGVPAAEILAECNRGMARLGERFAQGEAFIPELMMGGFLMKGVTAELAGQLEPAPAAEAAGKVVMGTVQYDVHDIGKDIVAMMLRGVGFEVIDLGINVAPERFVEAVREHAPAVVGLSVLLTTCFRSVSATVEAIRAAGLREKVSIMVGGAAASQLLSENAGCDFYGTTAVDGLQYAGKMARAAS